MRSLMTALVPVRHLRGKPGGRYAALRLAQGNTGMAKSKKKTGKKKLAKKVARNKTAPAKAKAKAVKKSKAPAKRKAPAKKAKSVKKAKAVKKTAKRKKTKRVRPPTFEQLVPAGEPLFVAPLDQV